MHVPKFDFDLQIFAGVIREGVFGRWNDIMGDSKVYGGKDLEKASHEC